MLKTFKSFSKKDWLLTLFLAIFVICQVAAALEIPRFMGRIVDFENNSSADVLFYGGILALLSLASVIALIGMMFFASKIGASVAMRLRSKVFDKVQSLSTEELNEFSTPSLITRTTNDISQVSMAVQMSLRFLIQMPIMLAYAAVRIVLLNPDLSIVVAIAIVVLLVLVGALVVLVVPKFSLLQKMVDKLNLAARENLTGLKVVRAYNAEQIQQQKFEKSNQELTKIHRFVDRSYALFDPVVSLIMNGLVLGIFWLGAYLINSGAPDVNHSMLVEFAGFAMQIIVAFLLMTMAITFVPRAMVSAKRIYQVIDKPVKIKDGSGVSNGEKIQIDTQNTGDIQFKNVSFKYADAQEYILKDINLTIKRGQTVGFVGSTGSGKSTLVKLIPRFYDTTDGAVLIDGIDVKDYKKDILSKKIGYVPQKGVLFSGTIKSNIAFGDVEFDDKKIESAASVAMATEFINQKDGTYDHPISQGGKNVSGGQRQRLSIARAVLKNPPIYIFDDSFSALDFKTDKDLRTALKEYTKNATTLIVASRLGTILSADKIVVLDNGVIVGEGKHEDLLNNCPVYKEIALSQLAKAELNKGVNI